MRGREAMYGGSFKQ
uniref:Uncharacterized protein n=1 Tax=Arundo donax TaxID=35708 RepID=A0A0A9FNX1_ARUDO